MRYGVSRIGKRGCRMMAWRSYRYHIRKLFQGKDCEYNISSAMTASSAFAINPPLLNQKKKKKKRKRKTVNLHRYTPAIPHLHFQSLPNRIDFPQHVLLQYPSPNLTSISRIDNAAPRVHKRNKIPPNSHKCTRELDGFPRCFLLQILLDNLPE